MDKLKPCPFCGSKPEMQHVLYDICNIEYWFVKCECGAEINKPRQSEKEAEDDWNKRI